MLLLNSQISEVSVPPSQKSFHLQQRLLQKATTCQKDQWILGSPTQADRSTTQPLYWG